MSTIPAAIYHIAIKNICKINYINFNKYKKTIKRTLTDDTSADTQISTQQRMLLSHYMDMLSTADVWGCQLPSIGRLPRWRIGERSQDIEVTGEIKYPGRT